MFLSSDISFHIISLGCAKNLVDSERINGALMSAGFARAGDSNEADITIINTCGFINTAKEESIDVIFDALGGGVKKRKLKNFMENGRIVKKSFPVKVVAVGCLTQRYMEKMKEEIPELDFICGITDETFAGQVCSRFGITMEPGHGASRVPIISQAYSYIKISDGCSNNCSFCAIPLIRGPARSFSPELVLADASDAAAYGVKELIIIAQDIASYRWGDVGLAEIVGKITEIKGPEWIRLMYCHPNHIEETLIDCLANNEKVLKYIDIPFQHASGKVLKSMGRAGDGAKYIGLIEKLRERVPGIRIRSSFMVGYPGEDEGDFQALMEFLREARLDRVGAFIYSPEEGTRSFGLADRVPAREKRKRYNELMKLQKAISSQKLEKMIGADVRVILEERLDGSTFAGRSEYDAPEVDGIFYLTASGAGLNSIVRARVTGSSEYDLYGEMY
ncbi:MAG: 30S ribosomal protein S12 methylthiotransferase RimO [Spirochaetes bacterium]|nr:30S ribosomal protein S12 methylthiotransferase RimO [Spirochaetota bacterium]